MSKRPSDVPPERLRELNAGTAETSDLAEALAVDQKALLSLVAPSLNVTVGGGITAQMKAVARALHDAEADDAARLDRAKELAAHDSDTVRGWACFLVGAVDGLTVRRRLELIRPLADDRHFGVREWAWLGVRPRLAAEIEEAVARLVPWTARPSEKLRRFATEATRPRGVWCAHIPRLKEEPAIAGPILEPLRADRSKYVQDSVANWLNDAGKSRPEWVRGLCARWRDESPSAETERICRRATRNL